MRITFIIVLIVFFGSCITSKENTENSLEDLNKSEKPIETSIEKKQIIKITSSELIMTKWEWVLGEECINYFEFLSEKEYRYYNCEVDEFWNGEYSIVSDTLFMIEEREQGHSHSDPKLIKESFKMVLTEDGLSEVSSDIFFIKSEED